MKMSTFLFALCVAAAFSFATDASAADFGPRATKPVHRTIAKSQPTRVASVHRAGPRGTIAVVPDLAPAAQVAQTEGESRLAARRAGPRATVCM